MDVSDASFPLWGRIPKNSRHPNLDYSQYALPAGVYQSLGNRVRLLHFYAPAFVFILMAINSGTVGTLIILGLNKAYGPPFILAYSITVSVILGGLTWWLVTDLLSRVHKAVVIANMELKDELEAWVLEQTGVIIDGDELLYAVDSGKPLSGSLLRTGSPVNLTYEVTDTHFIIVAS